MYNDIGKKLRYFRQRAGLSQLDLELAIHAAQGSISRIESGRVNPTKETVNNISTVLGLSSLEVAHLEGRYDHLVIQEEVEGARAYLASYYSKPTTFSYLLDERSRVWNVSEGFVTFIKWGEQQVKEAFGHTIIELLLAPEYNLISLINEKDHDEILSSILYKTYNEMHFLQGDEYLESITNIVSKHTLARSIWSQIIQSDTKEFHLLATKPRYFRFGKLPIMFKCVTEPLSFNTRFQTVEYVPKNHLLSKVLK